MVRFSATVTVQYDTPFSPFCAAEFDKSLTWLKESGLDAAEICICHYRDINLESIKKMLQSHGLACSTISTGQARVMEKMALVDPVYSDTQAAQKRLFEHIEVARILSSCVTIGLLRGCGYDGDKQDQLKSLEDTLRPVVEKARKERVSLLLEPLNRYETNLLNSAEDTAKFIDNMQAGDCMSVLWDTFHANIEDADLLQTIDMLGSRLTHVHIADSNRHFPGYGHIDFDALFERLIEKEFSGYISFECLNKPSKETVLDHVGELIKKYRFFASTPN